MTLRSLREYWDDAAEELDRFLEWEDRVIPGTAGPRDYLDPAEPLAELKPGVKLYDLTLA